MSPASRSIALAVFALSYAGASFAHAGPDNPGRPLYVLGGGAGVRLPGAEPGYGEALADYGYDVGSGVMLRAYGFGAYTGLPHADLGLSAGYGYMHIAHPEGRTIAMRTHTRQLGAFIRPRLVRTRHFDLGLRLEGGAMRWSTVLRNEALEGTSPYTRAQLELHAGGERFGVHIHVGHVLMYQRDRYAPYVAPELSGTQVGIGIYHRTN